MKTASFFTYTGPGRISIARFAPRGTPAGFRVYKTLAPGPWFNKVTKSVYHDLYFAGLHLLEPQKVWDELHAMHPHTEPVLLCWEHPHNIAAGETYCHRHMVAEWIKSTLGHDVPELTIPGT
jgi:hypothetical protein